MIDPIRLPPEVQACGYQLAIYRGDKEHLAAPGNKWHKLKYNIAQAQQQKAAYVATFGGPFSNHLHAFANVAKALNLPFLAVVRGELAPQLTPTLRDFICNGGKLWPSSRNDYRLGLAAEVVAHIEAHLGQGFWIPEGGHNLAGAQGCADWADSIASVGGEYYEHWVVSAGTGTTAAGLLSRMQHRRLHVLPAIKQGEQLVDTIIQMAQQLNPATDPQCLSIHADAHLGGYAKWSVALERFLQEWHDTNTSIPLDPVYTAKVVYGVLAQMRKGDWPRGKTLIIHTGGLQGRRGFRQLDADFEGKTSAAIAT